MGSYNILQLKSGKDKAVRNHHHWIFSGAVAALPRLHAGDIVAVQSSRGEHLGFAYVHPGASIVARMLSFDETPPEAAIRRNIEHAWRMRQALFGNTTNAFRVIHGEADGIPGLVVDRYADVLVLQSMTAGIEQLKPFIVDTLAAVCGPRSIYERSDMPARKEEGLKAVTGILKGPEVTEVEITEGMMRFIVSVSGGQKTGFFLDQRGNRERIMALARGKRVLNCFSYTGGLTVAALTGGATHVTSVDISEDANAMAARNVAFTGASAAAHRIVTMDVFAYLRQEPLDFDIVVLDPPAFAKKKKDIVPACRGYKDINRIVFEKVPSGTLVLTCSCSYYIDPVLFQTVLFQAASDAKREVRVIGRHALAVDHPVNLYHPETDYLKSVLLYVG